MKKFTTTFFLLMAMVLLLPTEVKATDYYLIGDFNDWSTTDTSYKFTVNGNTATAQISAAAFSKNGTDNDGVYFVVNAIESSSSRWYLRPSENTEITEGSQYSIASLNNSTNNSFCFKNPATSSTEIYTITLDFSSSNDINNSILTITKSGSGGGETGTGYYLYYGTGGNWSSASTYCVNSDNELKSVDGKYNVTFTIPSASTSKFYFCVFNGEMKSDWSNAIRPNSGSGTDDNNTATSGSIANSSNKVWLYETASTEDVTLTLSLAGVANGAGWTLTKGEIIPTVTYTLRYGGKEVTGTEADGVYTFANIPYTAFNGTSVSFQLKTVTDGVTTYYNMPSGTTSINAGQGYTVETSATGSDWTYTKTTAPNKGTFTVTLNTADNTVTLTDNTSYTEAPTPVTGQNLYLVGNFMFTDGDNINYDCEYFKLKDNGDNTYSIDIPATITVNFQLLTSDGVNKVIYGPTDGKCSINTTNPQKTKTVTGELADTEQTLSNYWAMSDRSSGVQNKEEAGMYTVTVTVDENGTPVKWSITHDNLTRVAYFLSDMEHAALQPSYNTRTQATQAFNNVHFGNVYLPAGAKCYVVSNIGGDVYSGGGDDMLQTKTKLYLQGNKSGTEPDGGDDNTKVYPIAGGAKPFMVSETKSTFGLFEYAPARGHGSYVYDGIKGEVRLQKGRGDKEGTVLPSIQSMKISGPGVGNDTWKLDDAVVMTYNPSDNCWEATINTTAPAGNKFRFVANDDWNVNWGEDDIAARIPYDGDGEGSPATIKEPNEVKVDLGGTSYSSHDDVSTIIPDIIFNRNGGRWTIKFYIETIPVVGEENFTYKFSYTINGYRSVLRTYCMPENRKPTDENIKIYGAYAFDDESGKVKLYEMNYIPANEGVILIGTGVDYVEAAEYTPAEGETKYKNIADDKYNNYLVGVLADTKVNASVFDGNKRIGRNFFFNYLSDTGYYEDGATDYLGFFRIKSGSTCKANYAYLHLPTTVLTWNGQTLDDVLEDETSTLSKGFKLTFGIADEDFGFVTGINDVQKKVKIDNSYYTLQGIRVNTPSKGIYIHNGKKVVIK